MSDLDTSKAYATTNNADDNFTRSVSVVFGNEGGYSNHPNDSGGATMMGVTQSTLNTAYSRGIVSYNSVKMLTRDDAYRIYKILYWDASHANTMPWPLCMIYLDSAVHHGITRAIKLIQSTINSILGDSVLKVDGLLGPKTTKYLDLCTNDSTNINRFCRILLDTREDFFDSIVKSRPANKVFLKGWLNRTNRLRKYLSE
jgi:peptidoglycan L-alanyl-D-glutamate endopeptidase CwlK|nr:MAG TPA: Lysozyme [Caudoviricetes sp.]